MQFPTENLEDALAYAIKIIKAYESEINEAIHNKDAVIKVPDGFCQGVIFKQALDYINKLLGDEIEHDPECDCKECKYAKDTQESDDYDARTCHQQ